MRNEREINRIEKSVNGSYLGDVLNFHRKRVYAARISVILAFVSSGDGSQLLISGILHGSQYSRSGNE